MPIRLPSRLALALCAGLSMLAGVGSAVAGGVALEIYNRDTHPLRCVVVLAHFMSMELGPVAPGATAVLDVDRVKPDGSLLLLHDGQPPKVIENLLCGRQKNWAATRGNVSLSEARAAGADRLSTACAVKEQRLRCDAWTRE